MKVIPTPIEGLLLLEPRVFHDDRGYFFESFNEKVFQEATGHTAPFIQDNEARSARNVLRGLHFQKPPYAQAKLLRVFEGVVWDVVVDLRDGSPTYGRWFGAELSAENKLQILVPRGFAHGYTVLSETASVLYKCDNVYHKMSEGGIRFDDPALNIDWKMDVREAIVSDKDLVQPLLRENPVKF